MGPRFQNRRNHDGHLLCLTTPRPTISQTFPPQIIPICILHLQVPWQHIARRVVALRKRDKERATAGADLAEAVNRLRQHRQGEHWYSGEEKAGGYDYH